MARTEVVARRTRNSKHFDNGDGTYTAEVTIHDQHWHDGSAWLDIDDNLYGGSIEVLDTETGEKFTHATVSHPFEVKVNKFKQGIKCKRKDTGNLLMLKPRGSKQVTGTKYLNTVTFSQPWDGLDVEYIVVPEGVAMRYTVTAPVGTIEWDVTDPSGIFDPTRVPESTLPDMTYIAATQTYADGVWTLDFTGVPTGTVME